MATWKQIQNLHKCKNEYRHRWIDKGRERDGHDTYDYYCKFCAARRIKESSYHMSYQVNGGEWTHLAPDCVEYIENGKVINRRKRR